MVPSCALHRGAPSHPPEPPERLVNPVRTGGAHAENRDRPWLPV